MPFFQTLWSTNVGCKTLQWSKPSSCYHSKRKLKLCQTVHLLRITSDKTQKDYCWDSSISQSHKGVYVLHKRGLWDPSISLTAKTNYCRWDPSISQSWWMHVTTTETCGTDLSECYAANLSGKTVLTMTFADASLMHSKKLKERPFQTKSCRTIGECIQRKTRYKDMNFCTIKLCQTIRTLSKGLLSLTSVDTPFGDFQSPNLKSKRLIHYMTICLRTLYSGAPVSNKGFRALKWAINIQKPTRLHHKRWTTPPS